MTALQSLTSRYQTVFGNTLTLDDVRARAPAAFAEGAHDSMSPRYTFIPTARVLDGLMQAGFLAVAALQTQTRKASLVHARHAIRLRRYESIAVGDACPEIVFLNSHDGSSGYQLRMGLYRAICANGLIVSNGAFPEMLVHHRGNVVDEVVAAALNIAERFDELASQVERMETRHLNGYEQQTFAEEALALRYPDLSTAGVAAEQLLTVRRIEDNGGDLWRTYNRVQENLLGGGLQRRSHVGRLTRTRRITAIRESVRLNSGLWDLASGLLAA